MCPVIVSDKDESLTLVWSLCENESEEALPLPWDIVQSVDPELSTFETRDCCRSDRSWRAFKGRTENRQTRARLNVAETIGAGGFACDGDELRNTPKAPKVIVDLI